MKCSLDSSFVRSEDTGRMLLPTSSFSLFLSWILSASDQVICSVVLTPPHSQDGEGDPNLVSVIVEVAVSCACNDSPQ